MQSTTFAQYDHHERTATDTYLAEISRTPLLSADEELRLARLSRAGDADARDRLIEANLRLVVSIAKRFRRSGMPMDDLIQLGNLGLMTAVDRYDPERGHRFSTYATHWIRQAISRSVADQARTIRLPVHLVERIQRVQRVIASAGEHQPTTVDIALALDLTEAQVEVALRNIATPVSLNYPIGPDPDDEEFGLHVPDPIDGVEQQAYAQLMAAELAEALAQLAERERLVLTLRYGLDGQEHRTLEAVGAHFGITRERARQIEAEALRKLRHPSVGSSLRGWLK